MAVQTKVTRETAAVFLNVTQGEHLIYRVSPKGSQPIFTLVDSSLDKLLMSNHDSPASENPLVYRRRWPMPADSVATDSDHTLGLHFLAATEYRYEVEVRDANDMVVRTLIDITYSSTNPDDSYFQPLGVTTA